MTVCMCVYVCVRVQAEAARDSKQSPMVQRNSSFATSHEVWKYINELGISKVTPRVATPRVATSCSDASRVRRPP